jgi:hypothetical protein
LRFVDLIELLALARQIAEKAVDAPGNPAK